MFTSLMPMTPRKFVWTTAEPFSVSLDPPAVVKTGVTVASVTSAPAKFLHMGGTPLEKA
jgi:hypothetical protein